MISKPTKRELEVLSGISQGKTVKMIATELNLSIHTVETYKRTLMSKLNAKNAAHMVTIAVRLGWEF